MSGKDVLAQLEKNIDREIIKGKVELLNKLQGHMKIKMPKKENLPYYTVCQCGKEMTFMYAIFMHHYEVLTEEEQK